MLTICGLAVSAAAQTPAQAPDGAALFQSNCASCHLTGANRAPDMEVLRAVGAGQVAACAIALKQGGAVGRLRGRLRRCGNGERERQQRE